MGSISSLIKLAFTATGMLLSLQVWAAPVVFTLNNVSVSSGADVFNITGSFTYDSAQLATNYDPLDPNATPANSIFTDFAFIVTDASNTSYSFTKPDYSAFYQQDPDTPLPSFSLFGNVAGADHVLSLEFSNDLNAGTTANVTYALFSRYSPSTSSVDQFESRDVGTASVSAVPEPDNMRLMFSGLMIMAAVANRRTAWRREP